MNYANLKKIVLSYPISKRNKTNPFEFGDVRSQDRAMMAATLQNLDSPQGRLLNEHSVLDTGFVLGKGRPPGLNTARAAFRSVQRLFESQAVEQKLKPWTILGFMTDCMVPNGLAGVLHEKDESIHFINVTAGAYFHTLFAAFHITADKRFASDAPGGVDYVVARAENLFPIDLHVSLNVERRQKATRIAGKALYATFFHELAHVLRGHTIFYERRVPASTSAIIEVPTLSEYSVDPLRRAVELDADDFSGRFLAQALFQRFSKDELSLKNPEFEKLAFEIVAGITLMYSWFARDSGYHGGSLRAYFVAGSLLTELGIAIKESAPWTRDKISNIQELMTDLSLLPKHAVDIQEDDIYEMFDQTMNLREVKQHDWLQFRPWK